MLPFSSATSSLLYSTYSLAKAIIQPEILEVQEVPEVQNSNLTKIRASYASYATVPQNTNGLYHNPSELPNTQDHHKKDAGSIGCCTFVERYIKLNSFNPNTPQKTLVNLPSSGLNIN